MLLLTNLTIALFLSGLIWTIQIVHYPLLLTINENKFANYMKAHQRKITPLVAPLMLAELFFSSWYLCENLWEYTLFSIVQWLLVFLIWVSTFLVQVPLHGKLINSFDQKACQKLIKTNWIRTICWSLRTFLLLAFVILN